MKVNRNSWHYRYLSWLMIQDDLEKVYHHSWQSGGYDKTDRSSINYLFWLTVACIISPVLGFCYVLYWAAMKIKKAYTSRAGKLEVVD
jgi:hypothetical protein